MKLNVIAKKTGLSVNSLILCMAVMAMPVLLMGGPNDDSTQKIKDLEAELKQVRFDVIEAQKAAQDQNKKYFQFQHDVVYSNENAKAIYMEISGLEKTLIDKKKELDELTQKLPEMRQMIKDRSVSYAKAENLRKKEQLILNEIKAERFKETNVK